MSACDCCEEPPYETPVLVCDLIESSKTKIGYGGLLDDSSYYKEAGYDSIEDCHVVVSDEVSGDAVFKTISALFSRCHADCSGSGSISVSQTNDLDGNQVSTSCSGTISFPGIDPPAPIDCDRVVFPDISTDYQEPYIAGSSPEIVYGTVMGACGDTRTVSNEYLTSELIAYTIDNLPSWPGTYDGDYWTTRVLSETETSYHITRLKYKLEHYPTASCYLKVWLRTRFSPAGGGADVLTDLTPYVWTGTGTPCLPEPNLSASDILNKISTAPVQLDEPPENGNLYIEIKKWSCVFGYEPDDPLDSGARPFPDLKPNGFPI
jgi:hypothetical protein